MVGDEQVLWIILIWDNLNCFLVSLHDFLYLSLISLTKSDHRTLSKLEFFRVSIVYIPLVSILIIALESLLDSKLGHKLLSKHFFLSY